MSNSIKYMQLPERDLVVKNNDLFIQYEKRNKIKSLFKLRTFSIFKKHIKKDLKLILNSGLFDYEWYINNYPNIPAPFKGVKGSVIHYYKYGWKQNKNPGKIFKIAEYLNTFPIGKNEKINPLIHYLKHNEYENGILNDYQRWIYKHEINTKQDILVQLEKFELKPKISIIVPIYNPEPEFLKKCIDSVIDQNYTNWQLCLADDCSTDIQVIELLKEYGEKYENINVVFRKENGNISEASNSALNIADGEWTALLDHDDELACNALFYIVKGINNNPNIEFIYSDEDKIDENGKRFSPHFKSGFNLDLLYSQNYISHLGVYKTSILKKINGFRKGVEGSQDYDLLLRYINHIDHKNIKHIPRVLYHWRAITGSTALSPNQKPYTTEAGIKALSDYFKEKDKNIEVYKGKFDNMYRVKWPIKDEPLVSIIMPTYNGYKITKQAINSILEKTTYKNYEIILIDNNSNDTKALKYFEKLNEHSQINVLQYQKKYNYSAINNFAVSKSKGEIIALLNNDVEVINENWLTEMVSHALRPDIGCVGAMLYYPDDTIQHAGVILGIGGVAGHSHKHNKRKDPGYYSRLALIQNLSAVTAACLIVRKHIYEEVNGLNEKDLTVAFNDVDFCIKVRELGYRNLWTPYAELYHHESVSRGTEDTEEKQKRFSSEVKYISEKWRKELSGDPYYSPNLTLDREDFSIKTN